MTGILARVEQMPDELTQASYISRLAAVCGCASARQFCHEVGIDFAAITWGEHAALEQLSEIIGVDPERLRTNALKRLGSHHYELMGCSGHSNMFRTSEHALCPACIAEDLKRAPVNDPYSGVYLRVLWHLRAIATCSTHKIALVKLPLQSVKHERRDFAAYGWNKAFEIISGRQEWPEAEPTAFENYLAYRLNGLKGANWLDQMPAYEVQRLCEAFGMAMMTGRFERAKNFPTSKMDEARSEGFALLWDGPAAMHQFLEERLRSSNSKSRVGVGRLLGPVAELLDHKENRTSDFALFRQEFVAFAAKWRVGSRHDNRLRNAKRPAQATLEEAADLYGLPPDALLRAAKRLGLSNEPSNGREPLAVTFDTKSLKKVVKEAQRRWSNAEARALLGVSNTLLWSLAAQGVLGRVERESKCRANRKFDGDYLYVLMEKVGETATSSKSDSDSWITLTGAAMKFRCSTAQVLELVLTRALAKVFQQEPDRGLEGLRVCSEEVFQRLFGVTWRGMSVRQASQELGTNLSVTRALANGGELDHVRPSSSSQADIIISETSVSEFNRRYVPLTKASSALNTSPRQLLKDLASRGIPPAHPRERFGSIFLWRDQLF